MGIRFGSLHSLPRKPHYEALRWRYERWHSSI
jgi:hypothetical protein